MNDTAEPVAMEDQALAPDTGAPGPDLSDSPAPFQPAAPATPQKPEGDASVPSWRLREINDQLRAERAEKAQLAKEAEELREFRRKQEEAAKPKPALWDDPDAWEKSVAERYEREIGQRVAPVQQRMQRMVETMSRRMAVREHGEQTVNDAYALVDRLVSQGQLNGDAVRKGLAESDDPFGDLVTFAKRHRMQTEIGDDPEAYEKRIREKILAEQQAAAADDPEGEETPRPVIEGPRPARAAAPRMPSLNRTTGGASDDAQSPGDVFRSAMRAPRR